MRSNPPKCNHNWVISHFFLSFPSLFVVSLPVLWELDVKDDCEYFQARFQLIQPWWYGEYINALLVGQLTASKWTSLILHRVPAAGIEALVNGKYRCLSRVTDNFFVGTGLGKFSFPLRVRLTAITGEQIETVIPDITNNFSFLSNVQFKGINDQASKL